ncbi:hypothetical protein L1987_24948 [Smallanthus sonchifolius]|uniref:Uncharacterized protein n=1 Tax=Smallanthus sonchifolius TaxID=185202 RepID=A0ACB9IM19_9ASTR|nr:hypothetical protein L1987_24948 [Smallanthus sonchifolius]
MQVLHNFVLFAVRFSVLGSLWVANRETPVRDSSGVFRVHTNGSLPVISGSNNTTVWSSNTSLVSPITMNPVAQLLSSGNLVVRGNGTERSFLWQSFDYPGDTFPPGMKFGKDLVSGHDRRWRPWRSLDDPSPGEYVAFMNTDGFPQLFEQQGSVPIARFGSNSQVRTMERYALVNSSVLSRVYVNPEGSFIRLNWASRTQEWLTYWNVNIDMCSWFRCGPNGRCNPNKSPACSCMEGFEPQNPDEWSASEWSSGCRRRTPLDCPNEEGFQVFKNVKLPDTRRSWYNRSMTLGECTNACKRNCSCTAYANIDITMGRSGCLLWSDDLLDVRTVEESQDLYVRMALSDLTMQESTSKHSSNKKRGIVIVAVSISSSLVTMILISSIVYAWSKKTRYCLKKPVKLKRDK